MLLAIALPFNSSFSLWIFGRNIPSTPHLFTCIESHVFLNLPHSPLIYVTVHLILRDSQRKTKTNDVPKWQQIQLTVLLLRSDRRERAAT